LSDAGLGLRVLGGCRWRWGELVGHPDGFVVADGAAGGGDVTFADAGDDSGLGGAEDDRECGQGPLP
jgi:hypothetical protein